MLFLFFILSLLMKTEYHICRSCNNGWITEDFNINTNQCIYCEKYDKEERIRNKIWKMRIKHENIDFNYVAGDPFW